MEQPFRAACIGVAGTDPRRVAISLVRQFEWDYVYVVTRHDWARSPLTVVDHVTKLPPVDSQWHSPRRHTLVIFEEAEWHPMIDQYHLRGRMYGVSFIFIDYQPLSSTVCTNTRYWYFTSTIPDRECQRLARRWWDRDALGSTELIAKIADDVQQNRVSFVDAYVRLALE